MPLPTPARLLPLAARLRRRWPGVHPELAAVADATIELAPADEAETSAAIALPGEIERATGTLETATMEQQRHWAKAGRLRHEATTSYRLDGATLIGTSLYAHGAYHQFGRRGPLVAQGPRQGFGEAQFCGGQGGEQYFGHWLCDNLATELLAQERALEPVAFRPRWMHETGYRALAGIDPQLPAFARFERLWVVVDRGYNQARIRRFRTLRARIRGAVADGTQGRRLYVARGRTGASRNLVNEDAVIAALAARGFGIVAPEEMAPAALAQALAGASLIVSVEGSALCHGLVALPEGARMLAIQPPDRFNVFNKIIGDFAGLRFGYVVAEAHADGFTADPDRLLRTLDLLERA